MKTIIFGILLVIASSMRAQVEPWFFAQVDLDSVDVVSMSYNWVRKGRLLESTGKMNIEEKNKNALNRYFIKNAENCGRLNNPSFRDYSGPFEQHLKDRRHMTLKCKNKEALLIVSGNSFKNGKYVFKSLGIGAFLRDMIKVAEFYKNKAYVEPTSVIKKYAKKKILIEYSDSLGKTTSCTILGKQITFGNKKVKDAEALKFCLTRIDDLFFNGNDMAQFYHIENKIKPEGKLSIIVDQKDSTEILMKDKVIDADRVMYNEKLYELINYIGNSQCRIEN